MAAAEAAYYIATSPMPNQQGEALSTVDRPGSSSKFNGGVGLGRSELQQCLRQVSRYNCFSNAVARMCRETYARIPNNH